MSDSRSRDRSLDHLSAAISSLSITSTSSPASSSSPASPAGAKKGLSSSIYATSLNLHSPQLRAPERPPRGLETVVNVEASGIPSYAEGVTLDDVLTLTFLQSKYRLFQRFLREGSDDAFALIVETVADLYRSHFTERHTAALTNVERNHAATIRELEQKYGVTISELKEKCKELDTLRESNIEKSATIKDLEVKLKVALENNSLLHRRLYETQGDLEWFRQELEGG